MTARINGPLSNADAAAWAGLSASAFQGEAARPWSADAFAALSRRPGARLYAACGPGGALAAIAAFQTVLDEAELLTLATAPGLRRTGLATRLLQSALADLKSAAILHVFLEVSETNLPARALYTTMAFVETGRRLGYYMSGPVQIDAIVMRVDLKP